MAHTAAPSRSAACELARLLAQEQLQLGTSSVSLATTLHCESSVNNSRALISRANLISPAESCLDPLHLDCLVAIA